MEKMNVKPATGKLGVLCVGLGAVTSTFMTGVLMARKGLAKPVGSMTQYDKMRVGRGENKKYLHYGEIVPLANLNDIVFGAWDVYPANAYESAVNAEVLKEKDINPVKDELEKIVPMKAAFDHNYASRLDGDNVKDCKNRWDMMEQLREDIRNFKVANNCDRIVVLWAASTEIYVPVDEKIHGTLAALEHLCRSSPKNDNTVTIISHFKIADIFTQLFHHIPTILAIFHIITIQTTSIVVVESSFHWNYFLQFILYRINIFLF